MPLPSYWRASAVWAFPSCIQAQHMPCQQHVPMHSSESYPMKQSAEEILCRLPAAQLHHMGDHPSGQFLYGTILIMQLLQDGDRRYDRRPLP